jgi:hypothetical protein
MRGGILFKVRETTKVLSEYIFSSGMRVSHRSKARIKEKSLSPQFLRKMVLKSLIMVIQNILEFFL